MMLQVIMKDDSCISAGERPLRETRSSAVSG